MKSLLLAPLLLGLLLAQTAAQAQDTVVELPTDWRVGAKQRVELVKEKEQYQGQDRSFAGGSRTLVEIEVVRKLEAGFVVRWTFGKTELQGAQSANPVAVRMANLAADLRLDIRTDAFGSVAGLDNLDEVVSRYRATIEVFFGWLEDTGVDDAAAARLRQGVAPLMNPQTVESLSLSDPSLFHLLSGGTFHLGTPQAYEDLLPNPFGGEPFPSKAYFLLQEVKPDEALAVIEWKQVVDPEKAGPILLETLTAMAERMNAPAPTEADLPAVTIEDVAHYVIDTKTGWPVSVTHQRSSVIGDRRRVDRLRFRMLPGG